MKTTILAALVALAAGFAVVPSTEAASITITTGDSGHSYRHDNGRHLGWYKHRYRHGMMRERRAYRECEVTTHRYWRHGRLIVELTRDCR
jgi:hypothetical protein